MKPKPKKTSDSSGKAKKKPNPEDIELHPDAWERFEKGLKTVGAHKGRPESGTDDK